MLSLGPRLPAVKGLTLVPYAERHPAHRNGLDQALLSASEGVRVQCAERRARHHSIVRRIEGLAPGMKAMRDRDVTANAVTVRLLLRRMGGRAGGEDEACALIREATGRKLGLRHYPVQLMGGLVLVDGGLAEMQTGEGKTIVGLLPAITVALSGHPVHIVTVNDYLAKRD